MTSAPTTERIARIVSAVAGPTRSPSDVRPDTALVDGGFWLDSVELLEVILTCETEFGIVLDRETDLADENLKTIGTLHDLIRSKRPR